MAKGVAGENSVTKYGSKSNPGAGHSYQWPDGRGEGCEGKCRYCAAKLKFERKGVRDGLHRVYWNKGKWSPSEPACKREPVAVAAKALPKKKGTKKGGKKKAA